MGYFKLDKLDKIFISILCVFVTFTCIINTFVNASENVEFIKINDIGIHNGIVTEHTGASISYFEIEPGYKYTITQTVYQEGEIQVGFSDTTPQVGNKINDIVKLKYNESYTFNSYEKQYVYCDFSWGSIYMTVTREKLPVFSDVIYSLVDNVSFDLWNVFKNCLPWLLVVVTFSLGVWFIKHNIIEHSKGREY